VFEDNGSCFARGYSVLSTRFNTRSPYFNVESKITRDFEAQCSLFTYKRGHEQEQRVMLISVYF